MKEHDHHVALEVAAAPTVSEVEAILREVHLDDMPEEYEIVEEGEWEDCGKFSTSFNVIKHVPTETYFSVSMSRDGSYWSGYEFGIDYVEKVRKVEVVKTVTEWVAV